jgi:hypothetical protein
LDFICWPFSVFSLNERKHFIYFKIESNYHPERDLPYTIYRR